MMHYPQDKIVVIDTLTYAGNFANLESVKNNENFTFIHGDICDQSLVESLLNQHDIDTLIHFAAESHVDRFHHVSTDEVIWRTFSNRPSFH